ncbi:hypothetical protein CIK05_12935 [Bdellovibrio sp. qaytius]|nr:hypothetical protein CIK05_12935 [Bdellovibrio sp. qaytius]
MKKSLTSAFIITPFLVFSALAMASGKTAYLSTLEDDDSGTPIYNCQQKKCTEQESVILNRSATVQITGAEFKGFMNDPFDDDEVTELFVPVEYSYLDSQSPNKFKTGKGFLPKYLLSEKNQSAFFSIEEESNSRMPAAVVVPKKMNPLKTATQIYELVGECPLANPMAMPKKLSKDNVFDSYVYNKLKKQKIPRLVNEQMKPMTFEDLMNIDSLARTIYGEMGKCFRKGLQYPIAAALVAVNRLENKSRFKEWTSSKVKRKMASVPPLTRIVTTPEKFNVWKAYDGGKVNGPLHHSLCPARTVNKPFWKTDKASQAEVDIWKNAVRIATEAVMFPSKFKTRSPAMKNINFYTSGMGQYKDYAQVFPFVNDRPLENFDCIEMWKEPGK